MKKILNQIKNSNNINLNDFSDKKILISTIKKEFIDDDSFNKKLIDDLKLRKNLLDITSQIYDFYYTNAFKKEYNDRVKMTQIFGPKALEFFTSIRKLNDEKNILYR